MKSVMEKEKLSLYNLLKFKSKFFLPLLGFLGIVQGLWGGGLLIVINNKIAGTPLPFLNQYDWLFYTVLTISSFLTAYFLKAYMIKLTLNFSNRMVLEIFNSLRFGSYGSYLEIGEERVRTAMEDVGVLAGYPGTFLTCFNAGVMILIGFIYMYWVYPMGSLVLIVLLIALTAVYVKRNRLIQIELEKSRSLQDHFMRKVNDFLLGFRELKMSIHRSDSIFLNHITKNRIEFLKHHSNAAMKDLGNQLIADYSFYLGIGVVIFVLPLILNVDQSVQSSFLVTILFLMGPIVTFVGLMDSFIKYKVSIDRLNKFKEAIGNVPLVHSKNKMEKQFFPKSLDVTFNNVTYHFFDGNGDKAFTLGPISFIVRKGEVLFIHGGNGSGKSTFIHLLSGLYSPFSGSIRYGDQEVTNANRSAYRDRLSCVFADHYLFSENYDEFDLSSHNTKFENYLDLMEMKESVHRDVKENRLSHRLSSGLRKRIALIYAMMENKDILILDEWAAEQDPTFRKFFYEDVVPYLKNSGKTVIAITHDDAYYKFCDRLIKFEYGQIVEKRNDSRDSFEVAVHG